MRTGKKINGTQYGYVLDGTRLVRDGSTGAEYLYDSEKKVCGMVYNEEVYYFAKNLQGDVIALTNSDGRVIAQYSYDAWGKCTVKPMQSIHTEAANANVFRYRSYIYDTDLGMYYLHNRYYDPEVGRFISEDPARDGTNWYAYCNGDSVNYVDPTGLWRTVNLGYQAESGDTLWGLSVKLFGNGAYWEDLGYPYDLNERGLRVGDIIGYDGGLIEYENGQAYVHKSSILYQNGGYHTPQPMPEPPKPAPPNPVSTPKPNTGKTPSPSTSSPGNGGSGGNKGGGNIMEDWKFDITLPLDPIEFFKFRDVTYEVNAALNKAATLAKGLRDYVDRMPWPQKYGGEMGLYATFYSWVNHGAAWDIKRPEPWVATIGTVFPGSGRLITYKGMLVTPEGLGNYTYGYLGAAFGFSYQMLLTGSYAAAGFPSNGSAFDNEIEDEKYVLLGFMSYYL